MLNLTEYKKAERVFHYFEEICKIPHGSGNTSKMADYLISFAKEQGLDYYRDEANNVIIRKAAAVGLGKKPTVAIQGHTDMVAVKCPDCQKDMEKEGIDIYVDGDFIRARGTSLGGDDGVAIAYALALLESDLPLPAMEAVFTSDEETGLDGAKSIDGKEIKSRLLINIDSDEEGVLVAGCAGGVRADTFISAKRKKIPRAVGLLTVSGLMGGHSGMEIHKDRTNAIRLLCDLLSGLEGLCISEINGGEAGNAIPTSASALIFTDNEDELFARIEKTLKDEKKKEPGIEIIYKPRTAFTETYGTEDSERIISAVLEMPNGVIRMHEEIEGLVETSLNLGVVRTLEEGVSLEHSVRSSIEKNKQDVCSDITRVAKKYEATCEFRGDYPGWEYRKDSILRSAATRAYKKLYGKDATVTVIHAGLECGIFSAKLPGLDAISLGPNNYDIHTTEEHLSISSTARTWDYLLEILNEI